MHNLVIDIGNTRTKAGWFDDGTLLETAVWEGEPTEEIIAWATNHSADNLILSTVSAEPGPAWQVASAGWVNWVQLTADTPLPIKNTYLTPQTLGKDRLAAVVGAWALWPGQPCLVVDAGTCVTFDLLTAAGEYLGGNIAPGVRMRLEAMHHFTARLPLVTPTGETPELGRNTTEALRNGGALGVACELEGLVARLETQYNPLKVVLTGGDAEILANRLKCKIFVRPNLVLYGLNQILSYNVE